MGEHLLEVLGCAGIAAYLQPASDLHPVTRTTTLPGRPTDRLFADSEHLHTAKEYLAQAETPSKLDDAPDENIDPYLNLDIDEAWAGIVAGFDEEADEVPAAEEGTKPSVPRPVDARWVLAEPPQAGADEPSLLDALDTFGAGLAGDDDDGYTPPPPPPVPRPSRSAVLGVLAVVCGLWVFFSPSLLPIDANLALLVGFCSLVSGVGVLIWRLRPDDDDHNDDGAVV